MFSLYLNSLYKLLFEANPLWTIFFQLMHSIQSLLGYQQNMAKAADKLHRLEDRLATFDREVNYKQETEHKRFDLYR